MGGINITADGYIEELMDARWYAMRALKEGHPDCVTLGTMFDPARVVEAADGAAQVVRRLREHVAQGAARVEVWKDLGLTVRDGDGRLVQEDDARSSPSGISSRWRDCR